MFRDRDEVGERVPLREHASLVVPLLSHLAAAANVCDRDDEAAIEQADAVRREGRVVGDAVRAVSAKQERTAAVPFRVLPVDDRNRNERAVGRLRVKTLGNVPTRVVSTEHLGALQEPALALVHVVIEDRLGRDERLVSEAEDVRVELAVLGGKRRVHRLGQLDREERSRRERHDAKLAQPVLPLENDQVSGEDFESFDHDVVPLGNDLFPVLAPRVVDGRHHDAEVTARVVDAQEEGAEPVVDLVFAILLARRDHADLSRRIVRGQKTNLIRRVAARIHEEVRAAARPRHLQRELLVLLLVDERIGCGLGREDVPVETIGAFRRVVHDVEERPAVRGPREGAHLPKRFGRERTRAQVLDEKRVFPKTGDVGRVGEQVPVVADLDVPEGEELLAASELVGVEHHLFGRVEGSLPPAGDRILLSLLGPRVVERVSLPVRDAQVGLFDPPEHLGIERLLKGLGRLHHGFRVGVLGLEMRAHLRVFLPAKPVVVVLALLAVNDVHFRLPPRGRRLRRFDGARGRRQGRVDP